MACLCYGNGLIKRGAVSSSYVLVYYGFVLLHCRQEGYRVILLNSNPVSNSAWHDSSRNSSCQQLLAGTARQAPAVHWLQETCCSQWAAGVVRLL
jgi:hypothetical protein